MARIYYVGDWAVQTGPVYAETPFNYSHKGLETINYGKWLLAALAAEGKHQVTSVPTWDFYRLAPGAYEEVLATHDIIVFSDVEAKCFQLAPSFFDHRQFGTRVLTFPDRIRLTVDAVKNGKRVLFLGGWLSFNGEIGKAGWGRTGLAEILPVTCLEVEDLRESTEGFVPRQWNRSSPAFSRADLSTMPPILGYNRTLPRPGFDVHAWWGEGVDPMLAVGRCGHGATAAYTSDPAPHWGCNFVYWKDYARFWCGVVDLLLST